MKSKNDASPKAGLKKTTTSSQDSYVLSALQIAPPRIIGTPTASPTAKAPRQEKPIKVTPAAAKSKAQPLTAVHAKIDVGFGNALYIRGSGDGLSWDEGTLLECVDSTTWVWSTKKAGTNVEFKLLLNDQVWAVGENQMVAPGQSIDVIPAFN